MSIKAELKNKFKKHIRKYIGVFCSLLLIPVFSVNSYAYTSYDNFPFDVPLSLNYADANGNVKGWYNSTFDSSSNLYKFSNPALSSWLMQFYTTNGEPFSIGVNTDIFNYYFVGSVYGSAQSISNFTFFPTSLGLVYFDHSNNEISLDISNVQYYHVDTNLYKGFGVSCQIDFNDIAVIRSVSFYGNGTYPANIYFEGSVLALPKSLSNGDAQQAIVNAINNQTSQLSSQLGDIDSGIQQGNDLIENGNEGTQSAVSDFNEVFEEFNSELEEWESFDEDIIGEFNNANTDYLTELDNFSLSGSLLNAGNWLSTSMQTVYDNSSDYKMLWLVPLLFGIPILLFIIRKNGDDE